MRRLFAACAVLALAFSSLLVPVSASAQTSATHPVLATHALGVSTVFASPSCVYTVVAGDTLSAIAFAHETTWPLLWHLNPQINDPNLIYPAQRITLCGAASSPPVTTGDNSLAYEPCQSSDMFGNVSLWGYPSSCYANVYQGVYYNGSADCFAWAQYVTGGRVPFLARHSEPVVGAIIFFAPGVLGASPVGHYGRVVGIHAGWMLVSNQNFYWHGGGYDLVNYRYVPIGTPGLSYLY